MERGYGRAEKSDENESHGMRPQEDGVDGEMSLQRDAVDPASGSRAAYSSSVAHLVSAQRVDLRWVAMCAQFPRRHDCEYIARKLPQHFVIQNAIDSAAKSCMPSLMSRASVHTWHVLAAAVGKSIQLKHGLLKVFEQELRICHVLCA